MMFQRTRDQELPPVPLASPVPHSPPKADCSGPSWLQRAPGPSNRLQTLVQQGNWLTVRPLTSVSELGTDPWLFRATVLVPDPLFPSWSLLSPLFSPGTCLPSPFSLLGLYQSSSSENDSPFPAFKGNLLF